MKPLFLVLCLLNVVLIGWEFHSGAFNPPVNEVSTLPSILLVSEYNNARRAASITAVLERGINDLEQAGFKRMLDNLRNRNQHGNYLAKFYVHGKSAVISKQVVQPQLQSCYEMGPFADEASLKQWLIGKALSKIETVYKDTAVPGDFQVYYPAAKTPEQLRLNKMMLNAKGITDIWVVPTGENKGALSLGVFVDRQRASNFKAQLAQRGIQTEVNERFKVQQQVFAKVMLDKNQRQQLAGQPVLLSPCRR